MNKEIWKKVKGYEDRYEVSSHGRVRAFARIGFHPKNKHGKPHNKKLYRTLKRLDAFSNV